MENHQNAQYQTDQPKNRNASLPKQKTSEKFRGSNILQYTVLFK